MPRLTARDFAPELLAEAGTIPQADAERVSGLVTDKVLGGGKPVGHIRTTF